MTDILLHRGKNRKERYTQCPDLQWSEQLDCWLAFKPDVIEKVFRDQDAQAVDYASDLGVVGQRVGYDFSDSIHALAHIPLAQEGAAHEKTRRQFAKKLSETAAGAQEAFRRSVDEHLRVFGRNGEVDLSQEFFQPVVSALMSALAGINCPYHCDDVGPSQIFDRMLSVNRRKRINELLGELGRNWRDTGEAGIRIAMTILGSDATLGSLQQSFCHVVGRHPGLRLDEMPWPRFLQSTAVPYIERVVTRPMTISGQPIEPGQRVRLYIDAAQFLENPEKGLFFGAGRHTCLGKPVSTQAWRHLADRLSTLSKKVEIIDIGYKPYDYVFNCPNRVRARIHD